MKKSLSVSILVLLIALLATACGGNTPAVTNTPVPTQAPTVAPTQPPPPTATLAPTATPVPTATRAPTQPPPPTATPVAMAGPAVVQLRYDLLALSVRVLVDDVDKWTGGDDSAQNDSSKTIERINTVLNTSWPPELQDGVGGLKKALKPVAAAVKAKDVKAAGQAIGALSDALDAVQHPYYGKWMDSMMSGGMMMKDGPSVEGTYIDLALNLADLNARVGGWMKSGDDGARSEALERIQRINTLLTSVTWSPDVLNSIKGFHDALPAMDKALKAKDQKAAETALGAVADAFDGLSHPYYAKVMGPMADSPQSDALSIQAAFIDIGVNLNQLDDSLQAWKQGSADAQTEAGERLERITTLLDSVKWPDTLAKPALNLKAGVIAMDRPLKAKDTGASDKALSAIQYAYDKLAEPFYPWLASVK